MWRWVAVCWGGAADVRRHAWGCGALLVTSLAGFGAFAWATFNPRDPRLDRLAEKPVIGDVVVWLQETWDPRPPSPARPPSAPASPAPTVADAGAEPKTFVLPTGPRLWAHAGQRLHLEPAHSAEVVARFTFPTTVVALGPSTDGWCLVVTEEGESGWLPPRGDERGGEPPLGRAPLPLTASRGLDPDPELEAFVREQLVDPSAGNVGPWRLLTDSTDAVLLADLDRLASGLEDHFTARYGVRPVDRARELVVLYSSNEGYRLLARRTPDLGDREQAGHFGRGIVALALAGRSRDEIDTTLVHELAHTLTRRAIGPALPPWLAEGIADDFAHFERSTDAGLDLSRRRRLVERSGNQLIERGWGVSLEEAARYRRSGFRSDLDTGPTGADALATLLRLDHARFVRPPAAPRYALAAVLVATLLDHPATGKAFRAHLAAIAAGAEVGPAALEEALGLSLAQVDELVSAALADSLSGSSSRQVEVPST